MSDKLTYALHSLYDVNIAYGVRKSDVSVRAEGLARNDGDVFFVK